MRGLRFGDVQPESLAKRRAIPAPAVRGERPAGENTTHPESTNCAERASAAFTGSLHAARAIPRTNASSRRSRRGIAAVTSAATQRPCAGGAHARGHGNAAPAVAAATVAVAAVEDAAATGAAACDVPMAASVCWRFCESIFQAITLTVMAVIPAASASLGPWRESIDVLRREPTVPTRC
jgi:hypothetical protein